MSLSRFVRLGVPLLLVAVVLAACTPVIAAGPTARYGDVAVRGAGSSLAYPLYARWFYQFNVVDRSVILTYDAIGSGAGIQKITAKAVDFGASDAILTPAQLQAAPGLQMLPSAAGAVVPGYDIPELANAKQPLVLDGETLAGIFMGRVTRWNDPALIKLNPGLALPDEGIIVVHRSDGSGTTYIFTDYLSSVSKDWKTQIGTGTTVKWPVGIGAKGNANVADTVMQKDYSIGYVELAYATEIGLQAASMVNSAGATITPSIASTQAAMAAFRGEMPPSLARSIVNAPGRDSWPIAGYTYLLVYADMPDCAKAQKLVDFIDWAQNDGTKYTTQLGYAPLPDSVRSQMLSKVSTITCQGEPLN